MSEIKYPVRVKYIWNYSIVDKNNEVLCSCITDEQLAHTIADALNNQEKMRDTIQQLLAIFDYFHENETYVGGNGKVDIAIDDAKASLKKGGSDG